MPKPIEVFFWITPNCWKVTIALEEMGLPYQIRPVAIGKGEQFKPEFLSISPNNRVPAITDPNGPSGSPISLFESGAILQYLARKTGKFYPADERERAAADQWLFWQVGGVGPMFGQAFHFQHYAHALVDDQTKIEYSKLRYTNEVNRLLGILNGQLNDRPFIAGDYSIADMATYPWVAQAGYLGQNMSDFPYVDAWLARVAGRPGAQRGMAVGADLKSPPPQAGSDEQRAFAASLFGQTAASVTAAAKSRA